MVSRVSARLAPVVGLAFVLVAVLMEGGVEGAPQRGGGQDSVVPPPLPALPGMGATPEAAPVDAVIAAEAERWRSAIENDFMSISEHHSSTSDSACVIKNSEYEFNLNFFANQGPQTTTDSAGNSYIVGLCLELGSNSGCSKSTSICETLKGTTSGIDIGKDLPLLTIAPKNAGVIAAFSSGDAVGSCTATTSVINFVCEAGGSPTAKVVVTWKSFTDCKYTFSVQHSKACGMPLPPPSPPPPPHGATTTGGTTTGGTTGAATPPPPPPPGAPTKKHGLSGGSIMMIIVSVSAVVYLATGSVVNWKVYSHVGTDVIPNKSFWLSLPGLVKDGVLFTFNTLTSRCRRS